MRSKALIKLSASTAIAVSLVLAFLTTAAFSGRGGTWKTIAKKLKSSAKSEAKADYNLALARALLLPPGDEQDVNAILQDMRRRSHAAAQTGVHRSIVTKIAIGKGDHFRRHADGLTLQGG